MWNLYEKGGMLEPLKFSNGKTQSDVVREIIGAIKQGEKVIFLRGMCGTGKSAIALNVAKEIGRASIVVPVKNLQKQYEEDYSSNKYLLNSNGKKLNIRVITGRNNHLCKHVPWCHADNPDLPCTIEIKEKNFHKLRQHIKANPFVNEDNIHGISDVKRFSVAPSCPYWSPILPSDMEPAFLAKTCKNPPEYEGLSGKGFKIWQRKPGCPYYNQFNSYLDADVLIFNSKKYLLETLMDRKPSTDIEIIDECDDFLDSFANIGKINLNRLLTTLSNLFPSEYDAGRELDSLRDFVISILKDNPVKQDEIYPLKQTCMLGLIQKFLANKALREETEEEDFSYYNNCYDVAKNFEEFIDETYVSFREEDGDDIAELVTVNLSKKFAQLLEKNKVLLLMSGTIHSEKVLGQIFGIRNFKVIEAETSHQGVIEKVKTGLERDCKYGNAALTREDYLKALEACVQKAKKPALVQVTSFYDLPSGEEKIKYNLKQIMSREELKALQEKYKEGGLVKQFKEGKFPVLFSTRTNRGVDFPGQVCNSIVITKYPYPQANELFWRVLKKIAPFSFWEFYKDKAKRELSQKIYRALRFKDDYVQLLSPDIRVLNENIT